MPEDQDDLTWRMEPLGWDAEDSAYFVLDDNRLYRRSDEPLPPPTPKMKPKSKPSAKKKKKKPAPKQSRSTRASKRRRVDDSPEPEDQQEDEDEAMDTTEDAPVVNGQTTEHTEDLGYGFTAKTWECIAITLAEYQEFLSTIQRSRDANEKTLRRRIEEEVLPVIEKRAEAIKQKQLKKLRDLENVQKMATAKRSSRLADKADRQAKEDEERQAELRKAAELRMAHDEQEKARRLEEVGHVSCNLIVSNAVQGHESRRLTREQRLKEREVKRILHEEELARLEREASTAVSQQDGVEHDQAERKRLSSRNLQNQQEAHRKELERLTQDQEEDKWYFDCAVCGMHGENLDDGSHSVACERCNVWQHSNCHGYTAEQCENENFHFICGSCRKKEKAAKEQKSGIVLKLGKQNGSPLDTKNEANGEIRVASVKKESALPDFVQRQLDGPIRQNPPPVQYRHEPPHQGFPQPYLPPNIARPPSYQPPPQHAQPTTAPAYPARGFAGTPPQRTLGQPMQGMAQHNWIHYNAVNGSMARMQGQPPHPGMQTPQHAQYGQQRPPSREQLQHTTPQGAQRSPQLPTLTERSPQRTPQHPAISVQGALPSSPHTSFPPPANDYNRQAAISPTKSSPPRPVAPSPSAMLNGHASGSFSTVTNHTASPGASFENAPKLETPSKAVEVAVSPSNNTSELATNGMKGPWPHGSLSVPHKHDSPATTQPK